MAKQTLGQRLAQQALPPEIRRIRRARTRRATAEKRLQEQRTRPRINIHDLNKEGIAALQKAGIRPEQLRDPDPRSGFEKVLDWVDLPRNTIAQLVGRLAGVDTEKIKARGAFGMKRVFMSDVLKKAGVKNRVVRAVGGFLGDVAIDPLTYLTAGATTGKAISRFLPKVKTSFFKELRAISRGAVSLSNIAPDLVKALGGAKNVNRILRIAGAGGKDVQKRLLNRSGGLLTGLLAKGAKSTTKRGKDVVELLKRASLKGRKVLRVPFTDVAGPTLKFGKQARLFKALGKKGSFELQNKLRLVIRRIQQFNTLTSEAKLAHQAGKLDDAAALAKRAQEIKGKTIGFANAPSSKDMGLRGKKMSVILQKAQNALKTQKITAGATGVQVALCSSQSTFHPKYTPLPRNCQASFFNRNDDTRSL